MYIERKVDLSVYYFIKDLFSIYPFVTIKDGFPDEDLVIPTVSIDLQVIDPVPAELGNRHGKKTFMFFIDIFAISKAQRDEFAYKIMYELENSVPVYDYDEGFPPTVSPTKLGSLVPTDLRMEIIRIIPEIVVDKLYYRSMITFVAEYNKL